MILNVSGRTDIIAFYTPWFLNRLKEGFFDVRNPFNPQLVSRIYLEDVDAFLFCTKNPKPLLPHIKEIPKPFLLHVTITPYKSDIEPNIPSKKEIIKTVKEISQIIGPDNIIIRYDPIFLSFKYNLTYHQKAFQKLAQELEGFVKTIIISFIDEYKNVKSNMAILQKRDFTPSDYEFIGKTFSSIAKKHNMTVQTCAEEHNLVEYGFSKGECLSFNLAYKLTNKTKFKKWSSRPCNCVELIDIGTYCTCPHLCKYCYANYDEKQVLKNYQKHYENSSLLIGKITENDIIKVRKK